MNLEEIKGLGKARIRALNSAGIETSEDLVMFFPKKYYDFSNLSAYSDVNDYVMLRVKLNDNPRIIRAKRGLNFIQVKANDLVGGGVITLVWFNQNYLTNSLNAGDVLFVYGRSSKTKKNFFNVTLHKKENNVNSNELFAVYKTFENVGQAILRSSIKSVLDNTTFSGLIPEHIRAIFGIEPLDWAISAIHFPRNTSELDGAFARLGLENALVYAAINEQRKLFSKNERGYHFDNLDILLKEFCALLPWELTDSQMSAIREINADLESEKSMNRLIEGDVGCGKTVVSLWAMFAAAREGKQAVLMAPTEILAEQHYDFFSKILAKTKIRVSLLTASTPSNVKKEIINGLASGDIGIVVGTNAILNESVRFKSLALAVVDEQHKFGVNARARLAAKGKNIDFLSMSATPIPRSVSLILYGGLDLTRIMARPNAVNTQTNLVRAGKEDDMWEFVRNEIAGGRTCYVVCPKIEDLEESDILSTSEVAKRLSVRFGNEIVCELNGRMKESTKTEVLRKFKNGEIKILVSTTVVEVGVDAVNAGVIVIMNPDRFGLATLHQLRGRVSRDGKKSYCFCLCNSNMSQKSAERLTYFKNNNNGFDIADYDLKTRGGGDMIGTRQHGFYGDHGVTLTMYSQAEEILEEIKNYPSAYARLIDYAERKYPKLLQELILN